MGSFLKPPHSQKWRRAKLSKVSKFILFNVNKQTNKQTNKHHQVKILPKKCRLNDPTIGVSPQTQKLQS